MIVGLNDTNPGIDGALQLRELVKDQVDKALGLRSTKSAEGANSLPAKYTELAKSSSAKQDCGKQCTDHSDCTGGCNFCSGPGGHCEEGVKPHYIADQAFWAELQDAFDKEILHMY